CRFFRRHILQDQAPRFPSAPSHSSRPRREGGIHSRKQTFLYPREKYSAASGLSGKIEVHYGENRPYFRPIDSRGRRALEKVTACVEKGGPASFRPPFHASALLHPSGHLSGPRQSDGSHPSFHRPRPGKASRRRREGSSERRGALWNRFKDGFSTSTPTRTG